LQRFIEERSPSLPQVALAAASMNELRHGRCAAGTEALCRLLRHSRFRQAVSQHPIRTTVITILVLIVLLGIWTMTGHASGGLSTRSTIRGTGRNDGKGYQDRRPPRSNLLIYMSGIGAASGSDAGNRRAERLIAAATHAMPNVSSVPLNT
jgi:hypothetical protein